MATTDAILAELQDQGARTIQLIEALQASNERQRESNELLRSRLGAATGSDPSALAGAGETSTPASLHAPDSPGPLKSYSHGNHVPAGVMTTDPLRNEKEVLKLLGNERLMPYERDMNDSLEEIADLFITRYESIANHNH